MPKSAFTPTRGRKTILVIMSLLVLTLTAMTAQAKTIVILCFGDSLTAGYGLSPSRSYPSLLEARLKRDGFDVRVINAGLSGDTSGGGLGRLDWSLKERPDIAIVELGANDGLRGLPTDRLEANLDGILNKLKAAEVQVVFTGMLAPRNMGKEYAERFDAVYPRLARRHAVAAFYPFFLEGVAGRPELNQIDGIHPNDKGTEKIVFNLYPIVKKLVKQAAEKPLP